MKKSLIALLVATLPAAAFADVTIYGKIKGGVEYVDNGSTKQTNIDDLGSRIGFKGKEDLGNGLKAIWQVETGFGIDGQSRTGSGSGTFANRNSFIGLQSDLGTLRLGNVSNFMDSDMGIVDSWEYRNDALGLGIFTRDGNRLKNSVRYDLPSIAGFSAALQYGTKENKAGTADTTGKVQSDREVYNLGLGYENSGFFGKYSFQREGTAIIDGNNSRRNDKHRLEVGYNANNLLVAFGYQQEKGGLDVVKGSTWYDLVNKGLDLTNVDLTQNVKTREYALTTAYTIGAFTPKFTYAHGDKVEVGGVKLNDSTYNQFVLGVDYAISKRTTFGAQYGLIDVKGGKNDANKDLKAFGLNMIHAF
ncbi:porin [Chromobacterium haemolyticum]|uniref:porin n=1 Tax=Chromobacterium haemolyticum TaxID=394935 RepID=UPI0009DAA583|nr:porin [Chromobacterium haemolyticum]OQS41223.1 porin [Chromobacterium haemolyticum]